MSHFTVLVPADSRNDLDAKMLPFHEYGWGTDLGEAEKQFLEFEDRTDEELGSWRKHVGQMLGEIMSERWQKEHPDRAGDVIEEDKILDLAREWGDYQEHPEQPGRFGYWNNPNAKWDWFSVGGRWSGLLKLKPLETQEVKGLPPCNGFSEGEIAALLTLYRENRDKFMRTVAKYGGKDMEILKHVQTLDRGEVMVYPEGDEVGSGMGGAFNPTNSDPGKADYALAGWVDWDDILQGQLECRMNTYRLYQDAVAKARKAMERRNEPRQGAAFGETSAIIQINGSEWTAEMESIATEAGETYRDGERRGDNCRAAFAAEQDYATSRIANRIAHKEHDLWLLFDTFEEAAQRFYDTEDEHWARFSAEALTYAFVDLEGNWNSKGEMGWFGHSSGEDDEYDEAFWRFVRSLPDGQRVYAVDCHI